MYIPSFAQFKLVPEKNLLEPIPKEISGSRSSQKTFKLIKFGVQTHSRTNYSSSKLGFLLFGMLSPVTEAYLVVLSSSSSSSLPLHGSSIMLLTHGLAWDLNHAFYLWLGMGPAKPNLLHKGNLLGFPEWWLQSNNLLSMSKIIGEATITSIFNTHTCFHWFVSNPSPEIAVL